jgi:hypothetical protein
MLNKIFQGQDNISPIKMPLNSDHKVPKLEKAKNSLIISKIHQGQENMNFIKNQDL